MPDKCSNPKPQALNLNLKPEAVSHVFDCLFSRGATSFEVSAGLDPEILPSSIREVSQNNPYILPRLDFYDLLICTFQRSLRAPTWF